MLLASLPTPSVNGVHVGPLEAAERELGEQACGSATRSSTRGVAPTDKHAERARRGAAISPTPSLGNHSTADGQRTQRPLSAAQFRLPRPRPDRGGVPARLSARVADSAEGVSVAWSRGGEAERRALGVPAHRPRPTTMHHTAAQAPNTP
jgi:hypothetical protein